MYAHTNESHDLRDVVISPDVLDHIKKRGCDFRICTSCGGPMLLPTCIKTPKKSDLLLKAGKYTIYVSIHQARFLHSIRMDMIPFFEEHDQLRHERR